MKKLFIVILCLFICSPAYAVTYCKRFPTDTAVACYGPDYPPPSGGNGTVGIGTAGRFAIYQGTQTIGSPYNIVADSNGNVGIGTTLPSNKLSVGGNTAIGVNYSTIAAPANGMIVEGNVGVKTSTTSTALDINGDVRVQGTNPIYFGNDFKSFVQASASSNADLKFLTNNAEVMRVTNGGNVGIGTTIPGKALYVNGNIESNGVLTLPTNGLIYAGTQATGVTGTGNVVLATTSVLQGTTTAPNIRGGSAAGSTIMIWGTGSGAPNANAGVDISGGAGNETDMAFFQGLTLNVGIGSFGAGPKVTAFKSKLSVAGGVGIGTNVSSSYLSTAAPNGGMIIESNVGIGTFDPQTALQVIGSITASSNINTGSCGGGGFGIGGAGTMSRDPSCTMKLNATGNSYPIEFYSASSTVPKMKMDSTGNFGIGTSTPGSRLNVVAGGIAIATSAGDAYTTVAAASGALMVEKGLSIGTTGLIDPDTGTADTLAFAATGNGLEVWGSRTSGAITDFIVKGGSTNNCNPSVFYNRDGVNELDIGACGASASSTLGGISRTDLTYLNFLGNTKSVINSETAPMYLTVTGGPRISLATDGNIGIGTNGPQSKLAIVGTGTGNTTSSLRVMDSSLNLKAIITDDGNVGIGTLNPGMPLDVTGNIRTSTVSGQTDGTILCVKSGRIGYCSGVIAGISCTCN